MIIREYSKNNKDYFIFDIEKRHNDETKTNPFMQGLSFREYWKQYVNYVERNGLKINIIRR